MTQTRATDHPTPSSPPSVPPLTMLQALEPAMVRGLERHLATATEWFPHEYVPYEVGRNYVEEPWEITDSPLDPVARVALEVNLLTEDNLPYYHLALWDTFGREGAWGEWVRRWTAEEGRHAIVLRDYLTVTRGLDPVALERSRMDQVCRGYYPSWNGLPDPLGGVVYATVQELATRVAHRNTGLATKDPHIEKLTARIAVDENLHYVFYREIGKAALDIDPSAMMHGDQPRADRVRDARPGDPRVPREGDPDGEGRDLRPAHPSRPSRVAGSLHALEDRPADRPVR